MKALIFAAGVGSRLKPFTDCHPKALATVGGVTMLERTIVRMRESGVDKIVVNVHHFASQITEFLDKNNNFGLDIAISDESDRLLDTGGGLLRAKTLLCADENEPVILHNADILTDAPLDEMLDAHRRNDADVTLLVSGRKSSRLLYFASDSRLAGWTNINTGEVKSHGADLRQCSLRAFGGVHIVSPAIFDLLGQYASVHGEVFSITPFYVEMLSRLKIIGFTPRADFIWHDIGTPEKLKRAESEMN